MALSPLTTRILAGLALGIPVLLAVWWGSPAFDLLIAAAVAILAWEWFGICGAGRPPVEGLLIGAVVVVAVVVATVFGIRPALLALALGVAAVLLVTGREPWLSAGTLYIGLPCVALIWLRGADYGRDMVFWLMGVVWATDIGAYAAGRLIGGPRLAPRISPNKTWAGLAGGMALAAVTSAAFALAGPAGARHVVSAVVLGALLAVIAQAGDLAESWVKRRFGVKDASALIPGHGGLLDRVDALLVVILVVACIAAFDEGAFSRWL